MWSPGCGWRGPCGTSQEPESGLREGGLISGTPWADSTGVAPPAGCLRSGLQIPQAGEGSIIKAKFVLPAQP